MACESQARDAESVTQIVEPAARAPLMLKPPTERRRTPATITAAAGEILETTSWSEITRVTRLIGPALGFGGFWTARRTLQAMSDGDDQQKGMIETSAANFVAGLSSWPLETSAHLLETLHRPTPHFATKRLALAKGA
jgi:hypothetical protein